VYDGQQWIGPEDCFADLIYISGSLTSHSDMWTVGARPPCSGDHKTPQAQVIKLLNFGWHLTKISHAATVTHCLMQQQRPRVINHKGEERGSSKVRSALCTLSLPGTCHVRLELVLVLHGHAQRTRWLAGQSHASTEPCWALRALHVLSRAALCVDRILFD